MNTTLTAIRRYPVKGMSGQDLTATDLTAGQAIPLDRRYGLLHGPAALDSETAGWRLPSDFFTLDRTEKLAALQTEFDEATHALIIRRGGRQVSRGRLDQPMGRTLLEQFFAAYLAGIVPGMPRLIEAQHGAFGDSEEPSVTLLNLASLRDLEERIAKQPVDPRRLRANLLVDGIDPWTERAWIGRTLTIGGATLEVAEALDCTPGNDVNPDSGVADLSLPNIMERGYGHSQILLRARVTGGGRIAVGDPVTPA
ncbi:MOSC domain-containing protein [Azospirillum humicireducens]|uniref:MOSC domain-containing protein n=1 Tax=Azospirillum humicireducens TaxID=1226968 RepID=A0A160JHC2_9PROT|nr:MOSC domain-containing protein [Azospirillum humicireducens]ANC92455.1 MOSC domain-containing protein [Azospirillum humicireducens]